MVCPYCGAQAKLVDSKIIYGKSYGFAWVCSNYPKCDSYVGCHPRSKKPLGTLANLELRAWRNQAHTAFDPIWKSRKKSRSKAYSWLAQKMNIPVKECHIGMFNPEQCKIVIKIMEEIKMTNNNPTFLVTGKVRLSFVHLFTPYAHQQGSEPKYSATILVPKSDVVTKQKIDAAIQAAIQAGIPKTWNGVRPPVLGIPVYDGDGARPSDGMPFGDECKGHWVFTASSKNAPQVVDMACNPILNQSEIYSGIYARASLNFFPYANSGKKGIGCGLNNVQKLEDGEPLGGRTNAVDDFSDGGSAYAPQPQYATPAAPIQQPRYQPQPQYPPQPQYTAPVAPIQQPQPTYPPQPQIDPITGQPIIPGGVMGV